VNRKLLLADESVTIQRVIELTFAGEDVQVISVSDGEQAIRRIPLERPDIVLADIGISKRSGYEVAAFVKQHAELSHVPVILLAGAFEPVDEARARHVGSDAILVKPFEPHLVVARVRELLEARSVPRDRDSRTRDATGGESTVGNAAPRVPHSESRVSESRVPDPGEAATSLDEYFDRLDAAFASRGSSWTPPPSPAAPSLDERSTSARVPTIEDVLAGASLQGLPDVPSLGRVAPPPPEPPDASSTLAPSPRQEEITPVRGNALAHAFTLILAVEQGELDSDAIKIGPVSPRIEITDELVDRMTRQVLARLAPGVARNLVAEIVSEVAERLVHEEIQRIRNA
jgi:CheY-like chemotaxis protein